MSKKLIIEFREDLKEYRALLSDSTNALVQIVKNKDEIREMRTKLIQQYANIEDDIREYSKMPRTADPVWRILQDAYGLALSSDILQRVGPAIDAVLDDLAYVIARYEIKKNTPKKNISNIDSSMSKSVSGEAKDKLIVSDRSKVLTEVRSTREKILQYLYDHRSERAIFTMGLDKEIDMNHDALLVESLYLINKGYIDVRSKMLSGDMTIHISAPGVDEVESYMGLEDTKSLSQNIVESPTTIEDGIVYIEICDRLYNHVKSYLENEDYFHAVEEAYKFVRARLKEVVGAEKATEVFGYEANKPIDYVKIFGHEPADDIEEDFFKGVRFIHLAVQFLRNEKAHTPAAILEKNLALQYISIANLAYDLISRKGKK